MVGEAESLDRREAYKMGIQVGIVLKGSMIQVHEATRDETEREKEKEKEEVRCPRDRQWQVLTSCFSQK